MPVFKDFLRAIGKPVSGKKQDLIDHITEFFDNQPGPAPA